MSRIERTTSRMFRRIPPGADWIDGAWRVAAGDRPWLGTFLVGDEDAWVVVHRQDAGDGGYRDTDLYTSRRWADAVRWCRANA